jgi:hypothetical protein
MLEGFAGNSLGTGKEIELNPNLQSFTGTVSPFDSVDYYSLSLSDRSSFNLSLNGLSANADVDLLNSSGEVLQTSAQLGINGESIFTRLEAGTYDIKVYSDAEAVTNYNLNLSATPHHETTLPQNRDTLMGFGNSTFETGVFTVGSSGQVSIDYLLDGGLYQGELAIFSLEGMEQFEGELNEFIAESTRRGLSDSQLGHVVINDATEGARFHGSFSLEPDYNSGDYLGVETFSMRPGDTFGVMLVPNGTVQQVFDNPAADGAIRPLFSLSTQNPNDAFHVGQIADATGDGNTFVMEDLRVDGSSDKDYNDIIFQVRGATGSGVRLDEVIDPAHDWRSTDLGKNLMEFIKPPENQPLIGVIDTGLSANNPDINPFHIHFGAQSDYVAGDGNPLLQPSEGSEHGTHITGIIAATQDNGTGINGINDQAPIYVTRAIGSGQWAQALTEIVDAAKESGQPNAIANLSLDLTQVNPDGSVTTRYEFTPDERMALEYARQNNVLIVAAAGNDGGTMSALGQASQEFDNIITVGSVDFQGNRADYSSFGKGLDIVAPGGTVDEPVISTVGSGADLDWLNEELDQLTEELEVDVPQDSMSVMAQNTFQEVFKPLRSSLGKELDIVADDDTVNAPVISTVGSDADIAMLTADKELERRSSNPNKDVEATENQRLRADLIPNDEYLTDALDIVADYDTVNAPVISPVGRGADITMLTADAGVSQNPAYMMAQNAVQEAFAVSSTTEPSGTGVPDLPGDLTPEEQQAYDEAVKEIDKLVFDYLDAASVKVSLDLLDEYFAAGLDVTSRFLDAFDENLADTLLKAQEALGDAATDQSTSTEPDFSVPLDLGVGAMAGTSVATAKVTGAASLVWAANPGLSYVQVKDILKQTAVDLNAPGWDEETGSGLVNIAAAVELAKNTQPQAYQPQPLLSPLTWTGEGQVTPSERAAEVSEFKGKYYEWVPYTVREGDNLSTIAYLQLGNGTAEYYNFIFERNRNNPDGFNSISDPNFIRKGWKIFIPVEDPGYLQRQEQERIRQEEIRRAEEEQRRAEEALRNAEEELRRAEEAARLEEERRKQEQLQALLIEVSKTAGLPIRSWVSNGVTVYEFATDQLYIQPDGRYAFYQKAVGTGTSNQINNLDEGQEKIKEFLIDQIQDKIQDDLVDYIQSVDIDKWAAKLAYEAYSSGRNGFVLPRFGSTNYARFVQSAAQFPKFIQDIDNYVAYKAFSKGETGFVLPRFGSTNYSRAVKEAGPLGNLIGTTLVGLDVALESDPTKKREKAIEGGFELAGDLIGTGVGAFLGSFIPIPGATIVGGLVGGFAGEYVGGLLGDAVNNNWDSIIATKDSAGKALSDASNAVSSFATTSVNAAKEKARVAVEAAKVASEKAKTSVQQAQVAYQNFKLEAQKATTQIVKNAEKVLKEGATTVYNTILQKAPRVAQQVASYANQAIKNGSELIDNTKQIVSNAIETGKQIINNVIETGKQAYETVKNFVVDTYEKGKEVVTETFNNVTNTVNNVVSSITNPIKSLFGW